MQRRSATIGLILVASLVLQETVGVLSDPERGGTMRASSTSTRSVASCRISADSSRLDLVIALYLFIKETRLAMMYSSQGFRHTIYCPKKEGSIHTPPSSRPEEL